MGCYYWFTGVSMDNFIRTIILFILTTSYCFAGFPKVTSFDFSRTGITTTYKYRSNLLGRYRNTSLDYSDAGQTSLNGKFTAYQKSYFSKQTANQTPEIVVQNPVSALSMATAIVGVIPKMSVAGFAIVAGTALYDYMKERGIIYPGYFQQEEALQAIGGLDCQRGFGNYETPEAACLTLQTAQFPLGSLHAEITTIINGVQYDCVSSSNTHFTGGECSLPYLDRCLAPSVWASNYSSCSSPPKTLTDQEAKDKLATSPATDYAPAIKRIHDFDPSGATLPEADPEPVVVSTPGTVNHPTRETVMPDGTVRRETDTDTNTKIAPDTVTSTRRTVTEDLLPDLSTRTRTSDNSPDPSINNVPPNEPIIIPPVAAPPSQPSPTDCDKYPASIGCSQYGDLPVKEDLPVENVPIDVVYNNDPGTCPSPVSTVHGIVFDYQPMCDQLDIISPILITSAFLISLFIIAGGVRD